MISNLRPKAKRTKPQVQKAGGRIVHIGHIHEDDVKVAYRRWAPVYDSTFGKVAAEGRRHTANTINRYRSGKLLEVGVGTGLSLPDYKRELEIVGIDLSTDMLDKARQRVEELGLTNVTGLHEMDAGELEFPDHTFDTTVAMYVMTVVPDPEKVMRELSRVTKPGGEVILVNHFSQEEGVRGWVERRMAPFAELIGWRPVFDHSRVMVCDDLKLIERKSVRPFGIFTMMRFQKSAEAKRIAAE
ncbi:MAG: SAM-dependent methyltransferase [Hyphomicrobium sp.]|jgi:phosphatidylethanolamine/phosphatidyl-N-methylethanolamine N-methyltransferase|nr:SAM-dependent methyltransferase [Hyphomicrobium sp.]PPD06910.1 MAG: SAM-dependent methyltransferase [Hyphomicrobium sp.]